MWLSLLDCNSKRSVQDSGTRGTECSWEDLLTQEKVNQEEVTQETSLEEITTTRITTLRVYTCVHYYTKLGKKAASLSYLAERHLKPGIVGINVWLTVAVGWGGLLHPASCMFFFCQLWGFNSVEVMSQRTQTWGRFSQILLLEAVVYLESINVFML